MVFTMVAIIQYMQLHIHVHVVGTCTLQVQFVQCVYHVSLLNMAMDSLCLFASQVYILFLTLDSFGLTENYYVFVEQPLCFRLHKAFFNQFKGEPFASALTFYPEEKVHVQYMYVGTFLMSLVPLCVLYYSMAIMSTVDRGLLHFKFSCILFSPRGKVVKNFLRYINRTQSSCT